jgi:hypothetical protein
VVMKMTEGDGFEEVEENHKIKCQMSKPKCEAPRPQAGASREGNIFLIVPLHPALSRFGGAGHMPAKARTK